MSDNQEPSVAQGPPPIQVPPPHIEIAREPTEEEILAEIDAMPAVGFPAWVKFVAAATVFLVIFSIWRTPKAIEASAAEARGERYLTAGNTYLAVVEYERVIKEYPESRRAIVALSRAYLADDRPQDAARTLMKLEGRSMTKRESDELDQLSREIEMRLPVEVPK